MRVPWILEPKIIAITDHDNSGRCIVTWEDDEVEETQQCYGWIEDGELFLPKIGSVLLEKDFLDGVPNPESRWYNCKTGVRALYNIPGRTLISKPRRRNTHIETWFERDRKHIALLDDRDRLLVEWWDEAVDEAVEDGFLKISTILGKVQNNGGPELHESAFAYYMESYWPHRDISLHPTEEDDLTCVECAEAIEDEADAVSTYCGSVHRGCLSDHAKDCRICAGDFDIDTEEE